MKEKKNIINFDLFTAVEISVESKNEAQLFHQRVNDGYINATELCKNANKRFNDWQRLSTTDDFLSELSSVAGIPATELVQILKGGTRVDLKSLDFETMWATQKQMAEIFDVEVPAISKHISNILNDGELNISVISKMEITASDGKMLEITGKY